MAEDAVVYRADHAVVTNDTPPTRPEGLLQVREGCRELSLNDAAGSESIPDCRVGTGPSRSGRLSPRQPVIGESAYTTDLDAES
jgi:hypothetical protein